MDLVVGLEWNFSGRRCGLRGCEGMGLRKGLQYFRKVFHEEVGRSGDSVVQRFEFNVED